MSLRAGELVLDRFKLLEELPGTADLWRWRAEDQATGAEVEVVAPTLLAALRPGAAERWLGAPTPGGPAGLVRLGAGTQGKLPVAARPPGRGPWPESIRLSAEQALGLAAWLGPEILALDPALPDGLRAEDLALDPSGVPRLAPTGLVHGGAIHQPPRHRPPELVAGGPATPESALYGLGVLLFHAVTGAHAVPGDTVARWAAGAPRPARSLQPDLDPALAALLDGLLDRDPAARRRAVEALPPPGPVALPAPVAPVAPTPRAAALSRPTPDARRDLRLGPWVVAVDPGALGEGAGRRVAALAGTTADALRGASGPAPVAMVASRAEAEATAARLAALGAPARVVSGAAPTGAALGAIALIGLAGALGLLGALLFMPLLLVALGLGLAGVAVGAKAAGLRGLQRGLTDARGKMLQIEASEDQTIPRMISEGRGLALHADLPDPALQDLLASLDALDDQAAAGQLSAEAARASLAQFQAAVASFSDPPAPAEARLDQAASAYRAARREVEGG